VILLTFKTIFARSTGSYSQTTHTCLRNWWVTTAKLHTLVTLLLPWQIIESRQTI